MQSLSHRITSLIVNEDGVAATEYAIVLSLVVLASVGSMAALGHKIADIFNTLRVALSAVC